NPLETRGYNQEKKEKSPNPLETRGYNQEKKEKSPNHPETRGYKKTQYIAYILFLNILGSLDSSPLFQGG
ncbi:MAG: hypothetical protein WCR42_14625, partial [bacterium]